MAWRWNVGLAAIAGVLFSASGAIAADEIILKYGPFRQSVAVEDLNQLAETGEATPRLRRFLNRANQTPETAQEALTQQLTMDVVTADRILNHPLATPALEQVGEVIYPSSRTATVQAMRSAIVLSASNDGTVTPIEVINNYPTRRVFVEGDRLVETFQQFGSIQQRVNDLLGVLRQF
ncbi:MAG: alpha/beta hydrolase [Kaiparowitsia implicata GSE-PSE-MK54-09C]|nr:alpha/beta hydrolase [Kaiparowitsia implicata GSE-PSE-MK54-09C]